MRFGVFQFVTDETIDVVGLARAVEARGFESLFLPEHTHIPAERTTPFPGGGELPRRYYRSVDPLVALGAAAAVTNRLRLGTGICLVTQRDPLILAKEVATLDQVSGGRVLFGVGAGWNREELRNHGTDPATRFALMRERVLAIKALWTQERASFHGEHIAFDEVYQWPKPLQRPHPPVLVGGRGPGVFDRVLDYGDVWFPNPHDRDLDALADRVAAFHRRAEELGRPTPVSLFRAVPEKEALERYAEMGIDRCVFELPAAPEDEVVAALDRFADVVAAAAG